MKTILAAVIFTILGVTVVSGIVLLQSLNTSNNSGSQEEVLELRNQHAWYNQNGWAEAAIVAVNTGEKDALIRKITVRSVESKYSDVYYWKTDTGPISNDLEETPTELSGNSFDILIDGNQRTFRQAGTEIMLPPSWTVVLYLKNPGNITSTNVPPQVTIAIFSETKLYFKDANVEQGSYSTAGAVLVQENVRYHRTGGNFTEIVIRNTGTADGKLAAVYWSKDGFSNLAPVSSGEYSVSPTSKVVAVGTYATITVTWGGSTVNDTPGGGWQSGVTYYWKIVTESGQYLQFAAKAP